MNQISVLICPKFTIYFASKRLMPCGGPAWHLLRLNSGGEGVDVYQGVKFPEIFPWQNEYDPAEFVQHFERRI